MRNTGGSGRSKSTKDKGTAKTQAQNQNSQNVKADGVPMKTIQATAEQLALSNLIHNDTDDSVTELKNKTSKIMELTGCTQEKAEIALFDHKNDLARAVNQVLEGGNEEGEWRETGKKKKKQSQKAEPSNQVNENNIDSKPEKRDNKERNDRDKRDRDRDDGEMDKGFRDQSDNYRRPPRRNDNRPPRLSRGRGRPDRAGDRPDRDDDNERDGNRDRGYERGRGRGRGGSRRGRGGAGDRTGGGTGVAGGVGTFRSGGGAGGVRFEKNAQFDNGPQIDTWTNETAVMGEKEPKISNWGDCAEDWNEDIDSWSGSLAETKVFTASAPTAQDPPPPPAPVQLETTTLTSNTFDLTALYPKHPQNDISADASYINQFNQQATESIKNSIGIGSGSSSSLQNSMTSQTASNVSALVSLQQSALQDNIGSSLTGSELTGNGLSGSSLTGSGLVGTSLGNGLSGSSLPVNSLSGTSLPVNSLTGSALNSTSLSGSNLSGNNLTGTGLSVSSLTGSLTANSLSSVSQSISAPPSVIPTSTTSQNAMLQQRPKPQRSKLPPPSKIPASAVEMPGHMMTTLDVQFGANLEFGSDSSPFSFGGNESVTSAFSSVTSSSTSTINSHVNAQVGQVPLSKSSETMIASSIMSADLEQSSPRSSTLYQPSPYTTPTKQNTTETSSKIQSPQEPLQMPGSTTDLKSSQLMSAPTTQATLPTTKIDSSLNSYTSNSSYQSSGFTQSHKAPTGYSSSTNKPPGSYPGGQYQSSSSSQNSSSQYSSQFRQSNQNQYQTNSNYQSASQYQSTPSGYPSTQSGYSSSQSGYQSNQSQYQPSQNQFQNFPSASAFQNQTGYSSNQPSQNSLYTSTTASSFSNQTQSSLYSQSSHSNSYSNQPFMNRDGAAAGSTYQAAVTQSSTTYKDQSGASSYRDNVPSTNKTRDSQSDSSAFSRDSQSASSFSDSQSMAYNRDSQSVGNSYPRDSSSSSYKRDTKSASGAYPRDTPSGDSSYSSRDSNSASSYNSRDSQSTYKENQSSTTGYRDTQSGASAYSNQAGSYPRDSTQSGLGAGASNSQTGYSAKNYRNSADLTTSTLQTALPGSKLVDNFSKMSVKESGSLDSRQSSTSQFDVTTSTTAKSSTSATSMSSITTTMTTSASASTTVTSSNITKISTLPSVTSSSKAPPNHPPGVPLMAAQQYIMGQAGTLPFFGLQGLQGLQQQPLYANFEDLQYIQQRMPPLATNNVYDMSTAAAGLPMPPTTLAMTSNSNQQTPAVPAVPYSAGTSDSSKLTRVDAQSPTAGSIQTTQQSATGQTAAHQQPFIHLNYGYYYPPNALIPGAGFQYPMLMPQVTNAAHAGTPANTQYQQKNYGSHHVPYGTNKVYDDLTQQTPDFSKSPYGSTQSQPKANVNTTVTPGTATSDIQVPGYGKTHAQAFDKQGFHAATPPPFNLLATGSQAGPLGGPTAPYAAAPFLQMMTHQPHSQMMHHPLQDTSSSSRGSQQTGSHNQSKSAAKSYSGSNWSSY